MTQTYAFSLCRGLAKKSAVTGNKAEYVPNGVLLTVLPMTARSLQWSWQQFIVVRRAMFKKHLVLALINAFFPKHLLRNWNQKILKISREKDTWYYTHGMAAKIACRQCLKIEQTRRIVGPEKSEHLQCGNGLHSLMRCSSRLQPHPVGPNDRWKDAPAWVQVCWVAQTHDRPEFGLVEFESSDQIPVSFRHQSPSFFRGLW